MTTFLFNFCWTSEKVWNENRGKEFFQKNLPKCLSELLECGLGKFAKKLPKCRNTFTHSPSIHIDQKILRKVSFVKLFSEHAGYVFDYFSVNFSPKFIKCFDQIPKISWRTWRKNAFHQSVRLNMEKAVLTTLKKKLCRMSENNLLKIQFCAENKTIEKSRVLKTFSEHVQNSLDNLSLKFLPKVRKWIAHGPEKMRKCFSKKFFYQSVPLKS